MKFENGQLVIVLDIELKPAGNAIVRNYLEETNIYEVDFIYPNKSGVAHIIIPEDRLLLPTQ